jgi:hypothetical protein
MCNNKEKAIKCPHLKFRKQGLKFLDDMHYGFGKAHVSGSSASCSGDISSDDASDEDEDMVPKSIENVEKTSNTEKTKRKGVSTDAEEKDEKSSFFRLYKSTCQKIETAAEKISTSVEASSATPTNHVPTIAMTMKMVKEYGVEKRTALMYTTTSLIVKPDFREVFSSLEIIEGRLDLIRREHDGRW